MYKFCLGDCAVLCAALLVFAASLFFALSGGAKDGVLFAAISGAGESFYYPLDINESISVKGPLGETVVRIENNNARIVSSPCANQSCVAMGAVHGRGQWLACLPNAVSVTIEGNEKKREIDAGTW